MAVKVYTPGQFYAAGGVVEEMFYQEVGRTKKYLRKRVGFVRSFEQVIKNLKDEAWRKFHYMKANVRGVDYTLVNDPDIQMPTDDGVQIIDYITIYANGNLDIKLLDRQ